MTETNRGPEVGIHVGVPFSVYQSWDAANASFLNTISRRTPYHAKHDQDYQKPETDAKRLGRALHSFILEPATFDDFWAVCPNCDGRTKEGKAILAEFDMVRGDRDFIRQSEFDEIQALAVEIRRQQCVNVIFGGRSEVSIVWRDKETKVLCKRRLDYERDGSGGDFNHYITDLKSTSDAGMFSFSRDIANYGYALAAAFSIDGWKALKDEDSIYMLLAVEKDYHLAKVWEPTDKTIEAGRDEYRKALKIYAECNKKDHWPAYGNKAELIEAPGWYLAEHGISQYSMV